MASDSGFQGTLDTLPLHSVLYAISSNGRSGTLTLRAAGDVVTLRLQAGTVLSVSSSDQSLRLGQLLIDQGYTTEEQIEQALALQSVAHDPDRIGEVLADVGFVTPEQVRLTIAAQLEAALFRILIREHGTFRFVPSSPDDEPVPNSNLFLEPLVLNAMYMADEWLARDEPADVRTLPDQLIEPEVLAQVPEPERTTLGNLIREYDEMHDIVWKTGSAAAQVKESVEQIFERALVRIAFLNQEEEAVTGRTGSRRQVLWLSDEYIDPWILIHLSSPAVRVLLEILNGHTNMLELGRVAGLSADTFNQAIEELIDQDLVVVRIADAVTFDPPGLDEVPNHQFELTDVRVEIRELERLTGLSKQLMIELLNGHDQLHTLIRHTGVPGGAILSALSRLIHDRLVRVADDAETGSMATVHVE